ncbi:hypothetical protein GCM10023149_53980 [Mucilaginibacter gynuensis]|uniref:Uncharacterized protein n=1 Tax=Mucilaginibacter gynuensis TaxID=1302236 RepID=A0ABP8HMZ8_9SPHI
MFTFQVQIPFGVELKEVSLTKVVGIRESWYIYVDGIYQAAIRKVRDEWYIYPGEKNSINEKNLKRLLSIITGRDNE